MRGGLFYVIVFQEIIILIKTVNIYFKGQIVLLPAVKFATIRIIMHQIQACHHFTVLHVAYRFLHQGRCAMEGSFNCHDYVIKHEYDVFVISR